MWISKRKWKEIEKRIVTVEDGYKMIRARLREENKDREQFAKETVKMRNEPENETVKIVEIIRDLKWEMPELAMLIEEKIKNEKTIHK